MRTLLFTLLLLTISFSGSPATMPRAYRATRQSGTFYLAAIEDNRTDKEKAAFAIMRSDALKTWFETAAPANHAKLPIVITINALNLSETTAADQTVAGRVELSFSFGLQKDYGVEPLSNYHTSLTFKARGEHRDMIRDRTIALLHNGLSSIDNWLRSNADSNRKLARAVRIRFEDYTEALEGDTIYYNAKRPLTWADFQSKHAANSRYEALVMPSIGYTYTAEVVAGIIQVTIAMKTYLPKSASWANFSGRDAYSLNHEQRHFDIVKVISGQFKEKVLAEGLTPDNFEAIINRQYLDSYRDMDVMQSAYDKETAHGTNRTAQEQWNSHIDQLLKKQANVYP